MSCSEHQGPCFHDAYRRMERKAWLEETRTRGSSSGGDSSGGGFLGLVKFLVVAIWFPKFLAPFLLVLIPVVLVLFVLLLVLLVLAIGELCCKLAAKASQWRKDMTGAGPFGCNRPDAHSRPSQARSQAGLLKRSQLQLGSMSSKRQSQAPNGFAGGAILITLIFVGMVLYGVSSYRSESEKGNNSTPQPRMLVSAQSFSPKSKADVRKPPWAGTYNRRFVPKPPSR